MSRTKRTSTESRQERARSDHPDAPEQRKLRSRQPPRIKLPRGAAERRRISYGYRTAPRRG